MCGRYAITLAKEAMADLFRASDFGLGGPDWPARYNICPTQPVPIVREGLRGRELALVRWGLHPAWMKEPPGAKSMINARSETASVKPYFRNAWKRRRALAPMNGHYEWRAEGRVKQPYHIRRPDGGPYAVAALWETWEGTDGSEVDTMALLTTSPNATLEVIHDRMPLILDAADWALWLDPLAPLEALDRLLGPAPDDLLIGYKVSRAVSRAGAEGEGLIDPVEAAELF